MMRLVLLKYHPNGSINKIDDSAINPDFLTDSCCLPFVRPFVFHTGWRSRFNELWNVIPRFTFMLQNPIHHFRYVSVSVECKVRVQRQERGTHYDRVPANRQSSVPAQLGANIHQLCPQHTQAGSEILQVRYFWKACWRFESFYDIYTRISLPDMVRWRGWKNISTGTEKQLQGKISFVLI